jgi:hypothetical protein
MAEAAASDMGETHAAIATYAMAEAVAKFMVTAIVQPVGIVVIAEIILAWRDAAVIRIVYETSRASVGLGGSRLRSSKCGRGQPNGGSQQDRFGGKLAADYVVAINVDTLYASSDLDLSAQPVVLTIPETTPPFTSYSILMLDPYGDLLSPNPPIPPMTPGSYALIGPGGFTGTLPQGVTPITLPVNFSALIFRADKFSGDVDQTTQANMFRKSLTTQSLSDYVPGGGTPTKIAREFFFSVPFKTTADNLIAQDPIAFLRQLQRAVISDHTPTLSPYEQALSDRFDSLFANRNMSRSEFSKGAQAAHQLILDRYLTFTHWAPIPTNWIHFKNIGDWGNQVVERSSITEFIQYANNIKAAAYYHAFKDANGNPLDGSNTRGYVLTFSPKEIPEATRFWSLTAYTPEAIELVPNPARKYAVASYTPNLQPNDDGSLSVYMAQQLPVGVPMANWLPIPAGAFNIMLRIYGPEESVEDDTYVPPPIEKR